MPDTITRTGKLFTAGDYPDKQFSLTEEELTAAIEHFAPVAANLQHRESLLDGKLGGLQKVWRQGKELFGEIQIPAWLHETVGSEPIKPSLEWDRATKRICGLAYVVSPRIADAALMSAFSAWEATKGQPPRFLAETFGEPPMPVDALLNAHVARFGVGQNAMQRHHDMACEMGAECSGKALFSAEFMTPDTLNAVQHMHDYAQNHGADCDAYQTKQRMYGMASYDAAARPKGHKPMFDSLKALFTKAGVPQTDVDAAFNAADFSATDKLSVDFAASPEYKAMTARLDAQKAEVDAHKAAFAAQSALAIQRDAAAFATEQVTSLRAFPAEKDVIAAAFAQAAADDAAAPVTVTFGAGDADKGSRVDALKALFNARTPHTRTVSQVAQSAAAVFTASADKTVDAKAKEEELLLQTELGRTVLAERRAAEKK